VLGDVFGRPGREILKRCLAPFVHMNDIQFVVVNAENAAGGRGLTPKIVDELLELPIDVITAGNHIWEYSSIHPYLESYPIIRPLNVNTNLPGQGSGVFQSRQGHSIAVVCMQGLVYMTGKGEACSNPFHTVDACISELKKKTKIVIVDFHAEATSEKRAMGWFLDGKVSAICGTHTHVQTSDEEIMPDGTAYISDLGMTGPHQSIIGVDKDVGLYKFINNQKIKFKVAQGGVCIEGVIIDVNDKTGQANHIERVRYSGDC